MNRFDFDVAQVAGFVTREKNDAARLIAISLEHRQSFYRWLMNGMPSLEWFKGVHTIEARVISKPQARNRLRPKSSGSRSFGCASGCHFLRGCLAGGMHHPWKRNRL